MDGTRRGIGTLRDWHTTRRTEQKAKVYSTQIFNIILSKNSLTKSKATILVSDSPKSSEAIEGLSYDSTPSCPDFGAAGAQDGLLEPSTPRALRKQTFRKQVYSGYAFDELEDGQ